MFLSSIAPHGGAVVHVCRDGDHIAGGRVAGAGHADARSGTMEDGARGLEGGVAGCIATGSKYGRRVGDRSAPAGPAERGGGRAKMAGMSRVQNTNTVPYRWVCSIVVEFDTATPRLPVTEQEVGWRFGGTGLVIARQYVLTCGHILRTITRSPPKRILVAPARKPAKRIQNGAPFGVWEAEQSWVHSNLFSDSIGMAQSYDFGLIKLGRNEKGELLSEQMLLGSNARFGWWGKTRHNSLKVFATSFDQGLSNRRVNVAGYPARGGRDDRLYHGFDDVAETFPRDSDTRRVKPLITYDVATGEGGSGAPIWTFDRNPVRRRVVAIHSGNYEVSRAAGRRSVGLMIRPPLIKFLLDKGVPRRELRWTGWTP